MMLSLYTEPSQEMEAVREIKEINEATITTASGVQQVLKMNSLPNPADGSEAIKTMGMDDMTITLPDGTIFEHSRGLFVSDDSGTRAVPIVYLFVKDGVLYQL